MSGISIRHDVHYNYLDTRYSMNYRVRINKNVVAGKVFADGRF